LKSLYETVCHIPAASVEPERLFFTSGYINSARRTFKPHNLEERALFKQNNEIRQGFEVAESHYKKEPVVKHTNWISKLPEPPLEPFFNIEEEEEEVAENDYDNAVLSESDEESSSNSEDCKNILEELDSGVFWMESSRPNNFSQQMVQHSKKRKRQEKEEENDDEEEEVDERSQQEEKGGGRKRRKIRTHSSLTGMLEPKKSRTPPLERLKKPVIGMNVFIHFTDDCLCKMTDKLQCSCQVWFVWWNRGRADIYR